MLEMFWWFFICCNKQVTEADERLVAKVTDFGMSRDVVNNLYYSTSSAAIPVRW